jgi:hypothetical protein
VKGLFFPFAGAGIASTAAWPSLACWASAPDPGRASSNDTRRIPSGIRAGGDPDIEHSIAHSRVVREDRDATIM